jgi:signal peptidase II
MKRKIYSLFLAVLVLVLDQASKYLVFKKLDELQQPFIELLPFLNIVKVYNYGVSFGMFNSLLNGRVILSVIAISITIGLCYWLYKEKRDYIVFALGLIIGGAVGNIIDRIRLGAVADFIDFYIGRYHWPAFNVADSAVVLGVFLIFIDSFIVKENKGKANEEKSK